MKPYPLIKKILLLGMLLFFTGCTYHLRHVHDIDKDIKHNTLLTNIGQKTCIYYDENAFVELDIYNSLGRDELAYDYGKGLRTLSERFFFQYNNIKFLNINDPSSQNINCDIKIYPKTDQIIYTYGPQLTKYASLEIEMSFDIHDVSANKQYRIVKRSEGLKVNALWATEYINLSEEIHKWVLPTIEDAIIEANKNPEEKQ